MLVRCASMTESGERRHLVAKPLGITNRLSSRGEFRAPALKERLNALVNGTASQGDCVPKSASINDSKWQQIAESTASVHRALHIRTRLQHLPTQQPDSSPPAHHDQPDSDSVPSNSPSAPETRQASTPRHPHSPALYPCAHHSKAAPEP